MPVTLEDFHFVGLPESLKAGDYTFALNNTGAEFHLLVIVKKKAGVTESFDELLADPAGESKVETVIGGGADPGEQANAFGHLEPGEYLALCPIHGGSTGDDGGHRSAALHPRHVPGAHRHLNPVGEEGRVTSQPDAR